MVICRYFQQGNCRFGQYCKFEHSFGNRSKTFGDEKNIALLVAEEVLQAERGGQWLLSCYGPFKERKCIPGMEDVSPEELRWEMYQAQKSGIVDQINAQFQQMCEQMKAKRDVLKNPTPAVVQILEEVQNSGTDSNFQANKGSFAFGTSQLGGISNTNQSSNVFGQKAFGPVSNPFGGSAFAPTQSTSSIFGKIGTNNSSTVFGAKPSFGNTSIFGGAPTTGNSIFGVTNKTSTTPFGGTQNNAPSFGGLATQGTSIFGGSTTTQPAAFGQTSTFGTTNTQANNSFFKPQTSQATIFGGGTVSGVQGGSVFGGVASTTPTVAGSIFGATPTATTASTGLFGQSSTASSTFGSAPVFSNATAFGVTQVASTGSVFGTQSAFGASPAVSSTNVFGGSNTVTSSFGALAQGVPSNAFGSTTTSTNAFESAPNASPFGTPISTAASPFNTINTAAVNPAFAATPSTTPGSFNNPLTSFASGTPFGFVTPAANTTSVFGSTTATSITQSPFGNTNTFANAQPVGNSVFTNTAVNNTTVANPFMANTMANTSSPFGVTLSTQTSVFGNFATKPGTANVFGVSVMTSIDETAYSAEEGLTDEEKAIYRMDKFVLGQIPLRPPTKELC